MLQKTSADFPVGALHVAELAERASVTPATIRYYSRVGLLSPGREPENGYRCYTSDDLKRVEFVRQSQKLGLKIGDIKAILEIVDQGDMPCGQVKTLVEQRLATIRDKLAEYQKVERRICEALDSWERMPQDTSPVKGQLCPLIEQSKAIEGND